MRNLVVCWLYWWIDARIMGWKCEIRTKSKCSLLVILTLVVSADITHPCQTRVFLLHHTQRKLKITYLLFCNSNKTRTNTLENLFKALPQDDAWWYLISCLHFVNGQYFLLPTFSIFHVGLEDFIYT